MRKKEKKNERMDMAMDQTKFSYKWIERKRITIYIIEREEINNDLCQRCKSFSYSRKVHLGV